MHEGKLEKLGNLVKELTEERLDKSSGIVAQMGHEPIVKALQEGAQLIICGRAYDPSPFAAVTEYYGLPLAYGYHARENFGMRGPLCGAGNDKGLHDGNY